MPRLLHSTPKYRRHRKSGQAVVTLDGRDFYLGPHGTRASKREYDRLVQEWLAAGRQLPASKSDLTIDEVLAAYWQFAQRHYVKDGQPTHELQNIRHALRPLQSLYGSQNASEFGPLALKAVREKMIESDLARRVINQRIGIIRRVFRWAASEELIPIAVHQALATVSGLQRGRTNARETPPVRPVSNAQIESTLPHLPAVVRDMVQIQRLTGCRPGEVCAIRPCDVDRSGAIWVFRPASHKTEHHDKQRVIFLGPRAQAVLAPYLLRDPEAHCFAPGDSERRRRAEQRERRRTPVQPSQQGRRGRVDPPRRFREHYSKDAYNWAIRRGCAIAAGLVRPRRPASPTELDGYRKELAEYNERLQEVSWSPNQLRHAAATEIRSRFGLEAAQLVLGHAKADVTQIYAERDMTKAAAIMREVG